MQQVHESVHRHQVGEPLLNEIVQACIWIAFLDQEGLWCFQRNSRTGTELVREARIAREHPTLWLDAIDAELDTAVLVDRRLAGGSYFLTCLLANRFDAGALRYGEYIEAVSNTLAYGHLAPWVESVTQRVMLGRSVRRAL